MHRFRFVAVVVLSWLGLCGRPELWSAKGDVGTNRDLAEVIVMVGTCGQQNEPDVNKLKNLTKSFILRLNRVVSNSKSRFALVGVNMLNLLTPGVKVLLELDSGGDLMAFQTAADNIQFSECPAEINYEKAIELAKEKVFVEGIARIGLPNMVVAFERSSISGGRKIPLNVANDLRDAGAHLILAVDTYDFESRRSLTQVQTLATRNNLLPPGAGRDVVIEKLNEAFYGLLARCGMQLETPSQCYFTDKHECQFYRENKLWSSNDPFCVWRLFTPCKNDVECQQNCKRLMVEMTKCNGTCWRRRGKRIFGVKRTSDMDNSQWQLYQYCLNDTADCVNKDSCIRERSNYIFLISFSVMAPISVGISVLILFMFDRKRSPKEAKISNATTTAASATKSVAKTAVISNAPDTSALLRGLACKTPERSAKPVSGGGGGGKSSVQQSQGNDYLVLGRSSNAI